MTRPEQALCWSVTAMAVQGNVNWLLCVCPCRLAPCVTWTLHKHQGRRRRTLAACRRLSSASAGRLTLFPLRSSVTSLSLLWFSFLVLAVAFFPLFLHTFIFPSNKKIPIHANTCVCVLCVSVSCGLACACITPSDWMENETNLSIWGLKQCTLKKTCPE